MATLDSSRFRETLGQFPTGVVLVTAFGHDGGPVGMIVGSFASVSLDPPLVAFFPARGSARYSRLRSSNRFCVNVLAADQEDLCRRFAISGDTAFDGVSWWPSRSGTPVVEGSVAWIDCSVESVREVGDHYMVVGRVQEMEIVNPVAPLVFFQGGYGRFASRSLVAASVPELIPAVRMAELARPHLEDAAERLHAQCSAIAPVGHELVFVAAAGSGRGTTGPFLGMRIPLMAPFGEQIVAWMDEETQRRWLDRGGVTDPAARARLAERFVRARTREWALSLRWSPEEYLRFQDELRDYTAGKSTPARVRAITETIAHFSSREEPPELSPDGRYDVQSIMMPVHCRDGKLALALLLGHVPARPAGSEVLRWIGELSRAAGAVARSLDMHTPASA